MTDDRRHLYLVIASFAAIYIVWGSTYLFIKIALEELPPFILAGMRFMTAGVIIFALSLRNRKKWKLNKRNVINSLIAGFFFLTWGNGAVSWAMQYVDSGFAALIISSQPLVLLIMLWVMFRKPILPKSWLGVLLGIIGVYLLISQNELVASKNQWLGLLLIFTALLSWAYGSIFIGKAETAPSFFINSAIQMLSAGACLIIFSFSIGEPIPDFNLISTKVWLSILYLIIFGSIIAFTAFNFLLKHISPEKVATSTYVNPIIAMILGWAVLDELITTQSIIAAGILLLGVYFINFNKRKSVI